MLRQSAPNLLLACGMTMVIILGGIDLSVGSIIAMSGVLGAAAVSGGACRRSPASSSASSQA